MMTTLMMMEKEDRHSYAFSRRYRYPLPVWFSPWTKWHRVSDSSNRPSKRRCRDFRCSWFCPRIRDRWRTPSVGWYPEEGIVALKSSGEGRRKELQIYNWKYFTDCNCTEKREEQRTKGKSVGRGEKKRKEERKVEKNGIRTKKIKRRWKGIE